MSDNNVEWGVDKRHLLDRVLLVKVYGEVVASTIDEVLMDVNLTILDVEQSTICQHRSLGMLLAVPAGCDRLLLQRRVHEALQDRSCSAQVDVVDVDSYANWLRQQEVPRHIVTLLGRQIKTGHMAAVSSVLAKHHWRVERVRRLTSPAGRVDQPTQTALECSIYGQAASLEDLRAALMDLSDGEAIDIVVQQDSIYRRHRRLVCFDMDSTLIEAEVIDELAIEAGVGDEVSAITQAAMAGDLDFNQSFAKRMTLLQGLDEAVLERVARRLPLAVGAERLFTILQRLGYKTAILSGGFDYFARYLQRRLGIDYIYANHLDIEDGRLTGKVVGEVVNGERKAALLRELAVKEGISLDQVIAVGDGANDLPMLSIAGLGVAFHAKPRVRAAAKCAISQLGLDGLLYLLGIEDSVCPC